mmetsp:Transcript_51187/g.165795  ORF Transcript_51187/g.165795 Transcript_51187/m.165795 type:complete len:152 (-) Transcript_51187:87-542(-)
MHRDPSCRLGARLTEDVQGHNFFEGLDFAAVDKREVPVPCALLRRRASSRSQSRSLGTTPPPRPLLSEVSATGAGAGAADDNDKARGRREKGGHRGGGGGGGDSGGAGQGQGGTEGCATERREAVVEAAVVVKWALQLRCRLALPAVRRAV